MRIPLLIASAVLALSSPALAQKDQEAKLPAKSAEPEKPVTEKEVTAGDVATTPLSDLNLKKGEVPPLLTVAETKPYDMTGLSQCSGIIAEINRFDAVLGEDIDIIDPEGGTSAGKVAQSAVGSLIPFRGLIREVSGANSQERKLQLAIRAGIARRSFLKGVGLQRGCIYPARPATPQIIAAKLAAIAAADPKDKDKAAAAGKATEQAEAAKAPPRKTRQGKR